MNGKNKATDAIFRGKRGPRRASGRFIAVGVVLAVCCIFATAPLNAAEVLVADKGVVNVEFHDTDLPAALRAICQTGGVSFVLDPTIKGKVTAKLMNTSWESALDMILLNHGLKGTWQGETLIVSKAGAASGTGGRSPVKITRQPGGTIDIDADAADIHDVLHEFATVAEMNIVATNDISGNVTLRLHGMAPADALKALADSVSAVIKQKDNLIEIAPRPKVSDVKTQTVEVTKLENGTLSIHVTNADVHQVLAQLSVVSGINAVAPSTAAARISLDLEAVTADDALTAIGNCAGLTFKRMGNVMLGEPVLSKLTSLTFRLKYTKPESVLKVITASVEACKAAVETETNTLVVTGPPAAVEVARQIIEQLEIPPVQVNIETRIIETNLTGDERLGITWSDSVGLNATTPTIPHSWPLRNGKSLSSGGYLPVLDPSDSKSRGNNIVPYADSDDFKFGFLTSTGLSATLHMLSQKTQTKMVANANVTTLENVESEINIVTKFPIAQYRVSSETGVLSISGFEYKEYGTILRVTARVTDEGIVMDIRPEVSRQDGTTQFQGAELPIIQSQETKTRVRVRDGETLVIAGLIREDTKQEKRGVPYLSKIPIIGGLFRYSQDKIETRRNLLIFITPHIVKEDDFRRAAELKKQRTEPLPEFIDDLEI